MKLFFKFFWRGIKNLLFGLFLLVCAILPIYIGVISARLLNNVFSDWIRVLLAIAIIAIGYYLEYVVFHSIDAVNYCKEHNTDSLDTAWQKTSWL